MGASLLPGCWRHCLIWRDMRQDRDYGVLTKGAGGRRVQRCAIPGFPCSGMVQEVCCGVLYVRHDWADQEGAEPNWLRMLKIAGGAWRGGGHRSLRDADGQVGCL